MQKSIRIGEVDVPIIEEGGVRFYPVSYITVKVLLRSNKNGLIHKGNREELNKYTKEFKIDFGKGAGIQKTRCISEEGLKSLLYKTQQRRLSDQQIWQQNLLHEELGIGRLNNKELYISKLNGYEESKHDVYTLDVINQEIHKCDNVEFQLCSKCDKYYPLTNTFFNPDSRREKGYASICHACVKGIAFGNVSNIESYIYKNAGEEVYLAYKEESVIPVYEAYREGRIKRFPSVFENKRDYGKIIKYLYVEEKLKLEDISTKVFMNTYRLKGLTKYYNQMDLHNLLFGEDPKKRPYIYPNYHLRKEDITFENGKIIFNNYIVDNKTIIGDPLTFKYSELLVKAKFRHNDTLEFAVYYNDYKYPGYLFKTQAVNYYKKECNLLFDLKYLIEKDMKIPIEKIPLYLTKNVLHQKSNSLYAYIVSKKNGSIYEWVNILYPNKFIETDFEVNAYRNEFDSDTECFIHEILISQFKNVHYNQKHTERTITLDGMIPDWFIFTDNGVWIIEYFGMYVERQDGKSSRITDYVEKTGRKIERYKELSGYRFIYLYPEDVENDYFGCREKFKMIDENRQGM